MYLLKMKEVECKNCIPEIEGLLMTMDQNAEVAVDLLKSVVRVQTQAPLDEVVSC